MGKIIYCKAIGDIGCFVDTKVLDEAIISCISAAERTLLLLFLDRWTLTFVTKTGAFVGA